MTSALALLSLTGCATFAKRTPLPPVPVTLEECTARGTVIIAPGAKSREEAAGLVADLRRSELDKARCAWGWSLFYEGLSRSQS